MSITDLRLAAQTGVIPSLERELAMLSRFWPISLKRTFDGGGYRARFMFPDTIEDNIL